MLYALELTHKFISPNLLKGFDLEKPVKVKVLIYFFYRNEQLPKYFQIFRYY